MSSPQAITIDDIARKAGVANSTVSKALRDDPTISVARCRQIKKIAEELGYRPHPMVAALMAQLHSKRRHTDPFALAWLDFWPEGQSSALAPFSKELLQGARLRANQLGYNIEVHHVADDGLSAERLRNVLVSRTQWGLIIPPVPEKYMYLPLDLRGFSAVTIGTSLREPVMHRVTSDHYQGAHLAYARLRDQGINRIGLALTAPVNHRNQGKWSAALLERMQQAPAANRVSPLILTASDGESEFHDWLRREKPEAVLLAEPIIAAWLKGSSFMTGLGHPKPVWLVVEDRRKKIWGVDHQPEKIGAAAVEMAIGQIHRNERGSPVTPHTLLLENTWIGP